MKRAFIIATLSIAIVGGIVWASLPNPQPSVGLYFTATSDPTAGGGVAAPLGQLLFRQDVPSIYFKTGTANTAWTKAGAGTSSGGTVTSVACGTGLSCAPSPIVAAGTVSVDLTPTTCASGMAEISTASDGTSACAAFEPGPGAATRQSFIYTATGGENPAGFDINLPAGRPDVNYIAQVTCGPMAVPGIVLGFTVQSQTTALIHVVPTAQPTAGDVYYVNVVQRT
jgi:hypothetical protein